MPDVWPRSLPFLNLARPQMSKDAGAMRDFNYVCSLVTRIVVNPEISLAANDTGLDRRQNLSADLLL